VRRTLDAGSPYVDATVHGDGLTSLQFRRAAGAATEEIPSTLKAPDVIQLETARTHLQHVCRALRRALHANRARGRLGQDLEELLDRKVDVLTDASLHPALRERILAESRPL
jgi:hypothetical protein